MKTILRLAFFLVLATGFTSCVKQLDGPRQPVAEPITGSWYLSDASESFGNGWYPFNANMSGVFTFYNNGVAEYDDGHTFMQGSWSTVYQSGGYYNEYGDYYTGSHKDLQVQVSNSGGGAINLYFDNIEYIGANQFITTYYNGKSIERYTFVRY